MLSLAKNSQGEDVRGAQKFHALAMICFSIQKVQQRLLWQTQYD